MMIRKLLATTAIVSMAAGFAYAAETPAATYLPNVGDGALASQWIGETVYSSDADNAETIGEINDLIIGGDGDIDAVIVGVGGFLGIGEKNVAVSFDSLRLSAKDGDRYVVLPTTKEALEAAPTFDISAAAVPPADTAPPAAMTEAPAVPAAEAPPTTAMTETPAPMTSVEAPAAPAPDAMAPAAPMPSAEAPALPGRDPLTSIEPGAVSSDDLIGATLYSATDENIGSVSEVVLTADGQVDAVVVDVGGFLGIGAKSVAISFSDLEFRRDENGGLFVYTRFSEEQLQAAADYVKDAYPQNRDSMLLRSGG